MNREWAHASHFPGPRAGLRLPLPAMPAPRCCGGVMPSDPRERPAPPPPPSDEPRSSDLKPSLSFGKKFCCYGTQIHNFLMIYYKGMTPLTIVSKLGDYIKEKTIINLAQEG